MFIDFERSSLYEKKYHTQKQSEEKEDSWVSEQNGDEGGQTGNQTKTGERKKKADSLKSSPSTQVDTIPVTMNSILPLYETTFFWHT